MPGALSGSLSFAKLVFDEMQTYAAIDIGSNSCRLKIARVQQHKLKVLEEDREVTRLGASVFETGVISPEAMAATLSALKRFNRAVKQHGAEQVRAVATSALRDARNASAFLAWVKSETGWEVEIISGLEEARLIHRGVIGEPAAQGRCLLIDVGGGSCEITLSDHKRIKETVSLPLGAVRLTREFLPSDPPAEKDLARLKQFIARETRKAERRLGKPRVSSVIATSGTAAALFDACQAARKAKPAGKRAASTTKLVADTRSVRRITSKLTRMTMAERGEVPGIGPKRSEIVVAGAHVYSALLEHFALPGFFYSALGLRDGILAQMLAEQDPKAAAHQIFEQERWQAVLATCHRYGVDLKQADPVRQHALQLFRDLQTVHELPPEYSTWLAAAAMMRDVGKFMNYQGHHRHAQYIIANSELFGFTPQQRAFVSAIARYLGKSRPDPADRTMRPIPPEEFARVQRSVVLLRLAVALNQDRASDVLRVKLRVYPKRVLMELSPGRTGAELELWSLRKEGDYFREVFRRELFAALA
jgi:exopolyphosphatase / guanosine-5'-triphosphate,3'-diphosphate pyrophosphatase